jgi:hypothetical protein
MQECLEEPEQTAPVLRQLFDQVVLRKLPCAQTAQVRGLSDIYCSRADIYQAKLCRSGWMQ